MPQMIEDGIFRTKINMRHATGARMRLFYAASLVVAFLTLIMLMFSIINATFGLTLVDYAVDPEEVSAEPLDSLNAEQLTAIIVERVPGQLINIIFESLTSYSEPTQMQGVPLSEALDRATVIPEEVRDKTIQEIDQTQRAELITLNVSESRLLKVINEQVIQQVVIKSWTLDKSLFNRGLIEREILDNETYQEMELTPQENLVWYSWLNRDLITQGLSPTTPADTGIRIALLGTLWIMALVILISFPLGVAAAIYLEEYANDSWFNQIIETNIRNLAGVPSIIYGMLGLAIFVRTLGNFTSGQVLSGLGLHTSANGRTILSAAATLSLLILPIVIAASQEALKAVPSAIREGSYGLGATKWQTISRQVLPSAVPGILTGTIIALSRAIGETAPLIVVGAATFITVDPNGPFSNFSALPIMIFHWIKERGKVAEFQNVASAAIIVLLVVLLTMNSVAVLIRNRATKRS